MGFVNTNYRGKKWGMELRYFLMTLMEKPVSKWWKPIAAIAGEGPPNTKDGVRVQYATLENREYLIPPRTTNLRLAALSSPLAK